MKAYHFAILLVALFSISCLPSVAAGDERAPISWDHTPTVPYFLNGPVAVLLTNVGGFSAKILMERRAASPQVETVTGELLGRGSKLLFAPDVKGARKKGPAGGTSFLWDVAEHSGYVLNEPLQGYAHIVSSVHFTSNAISSVERGSGSEKIDGHVCAQREATVTAGDGKVYTVRVWQAKDLRGFPIQMVSTGDPGDFTIRLSKVKLEAPPADLFAAPDGFTKYDGVDAMMNELLHRQPSRRSSSSESRPELPPDVTGGPRGNAPRTRY